MTECCGVPIAPDQRFCPRCGWECRVIKPEDKSSARRMEV
jgi:predicted nucleic acid-binding Zn ribbon protein